MSESDTRIVGVFVDQAADVLIFETDTERDRLSRCGSVSET